MNATRWSLFTCLFMLLWIKPTAAQHLEEELQRLPAGQLAAQAKAEGDATRGAVVFFQPHLSCTKCHTVGQTKSIGLGPDLTNLPPNTTDAELVESILLPSKTIRKGFESVTVVTTAGKSITGLRGEETADKLVVRELHRNGEPTSVARTEIEEVTVNTTSIMPAGQVNQLHSRQQFLDLVKYLIEIRAGGALRSSQLQPSATLLTYVIPEYEKQLDHAGLIGSWNADSLKRGAAIYQRVCANCHGTLDKPGSLPTSLRFGEGKFKNGSDPLSMYRTLTSGFGLMAPQTWMVPAQKYDVIHYIRETFLKPHNPTQWVPVDRAYLSQLPAGNTRGPAPSNIVPWSAMDYGPNLANTYEIPGLQHNLAYKGIAIRLDPGAGGVSRGRQWLMFDTDTLRAAVAWNGTGNPDENFIDWQGIQFNGAHGVHARIVGQPAFVNATGPGWASPQGDFQDTQRVVGRDGKRYGPLPQTWGKYRGLYQHGQQVVLSYSIGETEILESPGLLAGEPESPHPAPLFLRTFNIGPRKHDLLLQVAEHPDTNAQLLNIAPLNRAIAVVASPVAVADQAAPPMLSFDGNTYLQISNSKPFNLTSQDFTISARLKTKADGTIWSLSQAGDKWTPDGQTFFIRNGRLCFDIGWVGAVAAKTKVSDGQWHDVAMTWQQTDGRVRLYVDGKLDGEGKLAAKAPLSHGVARIGFTTPDFPRPATFFQGTLAEVRFYQQRLTEAHWQPGKLPVPLAQWQLTDVAGTSIVDVTEQKHTAEVRHGLAPVQTAGGPLIAGVAPPQTAVEWIAAAGKLRLKIPAGDEPLRFTIWLPSDGARVAANDALAYAQRLASVTIPNAAADLEQLTRGGPVRWPQKLETPLVLGPDNGPFATDILTTPDANPWLAQLRLTGLDFLPDGRIAVCSWDGDVWLVSEYSQATPPKLSWQRIATGLYQPLGLKVVHGKIHLTCRDQLVVLHDFNGDEETDYYQCLNNDHQVTEHFHEFAMGLQTDAAGNFYYAKSGCHGRAAIVPQHGTLLRVSPDGAQTEILATGFRAANGVCLNPDGSFVVTDQEGFWNPKNRINWVTFTPGSKPNFYGNMLGYHDVKDTSDAAMVPPLCWITNAFDRSPAELLWVESKSWGALNGALLNLSYGTGKVFLVPHEKVNDVPQGGMVELPIPTFPTGVMRGRFHPTDGQLYLCGMFAWGGSASQPGGLYRLRATGQPAHLPVGLAATKTGVKLTFTEPLDRQLDLANFQLKVWGLKRSAAYGSKHYDERSLAARSAQLSDDAKTLTLEIADFRPTWCMEIKYTLRSAVGTPFSGVIHNTVHELGE